VFKVEKRLVSLSILNLDKSPVNIKFTTKDFNRGLDDSEVLFDQYVEKFAISTTFSLEKYTL
jgi:hypothetical protein